MNKVFFVFFWLTISLSANAFIRIGNNGEGVLRDGKVYSLDLIEAGNHLNPYIDGNPTHPREMRRMARSIEQIFKPEWPVLKRKIMDIEQKVPGLGYVLLDSLQAFSFEFSEDSSSFQNAKSENILIAVRNLTTIVIWKQMWEKMDTPNRIALLLHESVYSLAKVQCRNILDCSQESKRIRPIVAALFNESMTAEMVKKIKAELKVGPIFNICEKPRVKATYTIVDRSSGCEEGACPKLAERVNGSFKEAQDYVDDRVWLCQQARSFQSKGLSIRIEYNFKIRGLMVLKELYNVKPNIFQYGTFTVESELDDQGSFDFTDWHNCHETLYSHRIALTTLDFEIPSYPDTCRNH